MIALNFCIKSTVKSVYFRKICFGQRCLSGGNNLTDTSNLIDSTAILDRISAIEEKLNNRIDEVVLQVCKFRKADECNLELSRDYITSINNENDRLRTENIALKQKVEYTTMVISDLNTKIKLMDEEKQSLVVAIRILQENEITNESGNQKSAFTETAKNRKQHLPEIPNSVTPSPVNNIKILQQSNTYEVLTIEDDSETNADENQTSKGQISITQEHGDQGRSVVNDQTKGGRQQHTKEDTDFQPTEKVNTANSECSEANDLRTNQSTKQFSLIIGDSMIKHINPQKLSKSPVRKANFPGKRAEEITPEINRMKINLSSPSKVIIHAVCLAL